MSINLGFCRHHPRELAVMRYRGPQTRGRWWRFCRDCWQRFYRHGYRL